MNRGLSVDRKHAIVVGGSMAGLLAARVLSDHFEGVSLIERDRLPELTEPRRGVPQGRHTHGLLASGRNVLEKLFPGISDTLLKAGAVTRDIVRDSRWFFGGACLSRPASGLYGLLMTRPLLEAFRRTGANRLWCLFRFRRSTFDRQHASQRTFAN